MSNDHIYDWGNIIPGYNASQEQREEKLVVRVTEQPYEQVLAQKAQENGQMVLKSTSCPMCAHSMEQLADWRTVCTKFRCPVCGYYIIGKYMGNEDKGEFTFEPDSAAKQEYIRVGEQVPYDGRVCIVLVRDAYGGIYCTDGRYIKESKQWIYAGLPCEKPFSERQVIRGQPDCVIGWRKRGY